MSNIIASTTKSLGGWAVTNARNFIGFDFIRRYALQIKSLGSDLLFYHSKGPELNSYQEIEELYGVTYEDALRTYRSYRLNFFVCAFMTLADASIIMRSTIHHDVLNTLVAMPLLLVFGLSALRYSYYCYETRSRRVLPFNQFLSAGSIVPSKWDASNSSAKTWGLHKDTNV